MYRSRVENPCTQIIIICIYRKDILLIQQVHDLNNIYICSKQNFEKLQYFSMNKHVMYEI